MYLAVMLAGRPLNVFSTHLVIKWIQSGGFNHATSSKKDILRKSVANSYTSSETVTYKQSLSLCYYETDREWSLITFSGAITNDYLKPFIRNAKGSKIK